MTTLPILTDPDSAGFFAAAARGSLVVRHCRDCRHDIHLPAQVCNKCHSLNSDWREVAPIGTLESFSHVERQVHPDFPVPYTLVLVTLDDTHAVRFVGHMGGTPRLSIGMKMLGYFETVDDAALLRWKIAPSAE